MDEQRRFIIESNNNIVRIYSRKYKSINLTKTILVHVFNTENYFINIFSVIYSFIGGELCAKILSTQDEYAFIKFSASTLLFLPPSPLPSFLWTDSRFAGVAFFFLFLFLLLLLFFFSSQEAFKHSQVIDWFMNTSRLACNFSLRWGKKKKSVDKLHPRSDVGFRGWNRMAGTKGQCMIPLTSRGCLENLSYTSAFRKTGSNLFFFLFFFRTHVFHLSLRHERKKKNGIQRNSSNLKEKKRKKKKTHITGMK